jgi:hypothetical protein
MPSSSALVAGGRRRRHLYQNTFGANHDKLVTALPWKGFGNVSVIMGELGWPTDGDINTNTNLDYAQRFNQGFLYCTHHLRPGHAVVLGPVDAYLFSLIDEDRKSI